MPESIIGPHGGYRDLRAYKMAEVVYDGTAAFTRLYLNPKIRTVDQMVQAARSGKQNIAEGSMGSATSKKIELKLVGVARMSLEELLLDYEDFLRQNGHDQWTRDHEKAKFIRKLCYQENMSYTTYKTYIEEKGPGNAANTLICLTHQANYLLDQLLRNLDKDFQENGGFTEKLHRIRSQVRGSP